MGITVQGEIMSLDFIKKPEIAEIVQQEYSDAQLERARSYISNYDGKELHRDFLNEVPFTITETNREDYWNIINKISPLSEEQTTNVLIKDIDNTLQDMKDPLAKLSYLRDGSTTWSDKVIKHFTPTLNALDQFATADTMHTATLGYKTSLKKRAFSFFDEKERYLDPLVPKTQHLSDMMAIERNEKWEFMDVDANGRLGIVTPTGEWLSAMNLNEGLIDNPEIADKLPNKNEQYHVNMEGADILMTFIDSAVDSSRNVLSESRVQSIDDAFTGLERGLIGRDEAARVIVNKIQVKDTSFDEVFQRGLNTLRVSEDMLVGDIFNQTAKLSGEILNLLSIRGNL